jgi:hypothetical protein
MLAATPRPIRQTAAVSDPPIAPSLKAQLQGTPLAAPCGRADEQNRPDTSHSPLPTTLRWMTNRTSASPKTRST